MKKNKIPVLFFLHGILALYALGTVCSKLASSYSFISVPFILCYAGIFFLLALYAVGWQQVIKRMPLTTAFANKAVTVVWGIVWGALIFRESITIGKVAGAVLVVVGVVLFAKAGEDDAV